MRPSRAALTAGLVAVAIAAASCGSDPTPPPEPSQDWARDILSTSLQIDVSTRSGVAVIALAPSESTGASFEIGDLAITTARVDLGDGPIDLAGRITNGQLDLGVPSTTEPIEITIEYGYSIHDEFDGAMSVGLTMLWPYHCGNLFPCKSGPDDGVRFELSVTGYSEPQAVFPATIPGDAPSYMLAWALGDYTYIDLGATRAGTKVGVWYLPGGESDATSGTTNLRGVFEWLEDTLGAYSFGGEVATVSANWGGGAFGGMEHHPFWHVGTDDMEDEETQAHEAAHGWFGNGVRMACWEEFVLSEGTVTYLAARSLEVVAGSSVSDPIWIGYQRDLNFLQASTTNKIAWPNSCGVVDIIEDGLFNDAPYIKGAFFFRALANRIGANTLDGVLATFYAAHVGKAAGMQDLLDTVLSETGYDATACATAWLRSESVPNENTCAAN